MSYDQDQVPLSVLKDIECPSVEPAAKEDTSCEMVSPDWHLFSLGTSVVGTANPWYSPAVLSGLEASQVVVSPAVESECVQVVASTPVVSDPVVIEPVVLQVDILEAATEGTKEMITTDLESSHVHVTRDRKDLVESSETHSRCVLEEVIQTVQAFPGN